MKNMEKPQEEKKLWYEPHVQKLTINTDTAQGAVANPQSNNNFTFDDDFAGDN